jgi:hypothetical protein
MKARVVAATSFKRSIRTGQSVDQPASLSVSQFLYVTCSHSWHMLLKFVRQGTEPLPANLGLASASASLSVYPTHG